jgi:hypothetical protein
MQKLLTTLAVLTVIATSAFAQSFDPDNSTGNVLTFSHKSTASQNEKIAIGRSGLHSWLIARASVRLSQGYFGLSVWSGDKLPLSGPAV